MSNHWSAFYWGDYVADTAHLSLAEHGAYLLLMAHYYRTRKPLPADESTLHRVCRCMSAEDREATGRVVREFFAIPPEPWAGFMEMRNKKRASPTDRAIELVIKELEKLRDSGQDVTAVLDQSTRNNWTDVYPLKGNQGNAGNGKSNLTEILERERAILRSRGTRPQ